MNWEMLYAFGQLVAAIGVIPLLIDRTIQIREQNKERRRKAPQPRSFSFARQFEAYAR